MFRLMIQKLLHKKWMVVCLLIGNVLLIATAISYPLYKNSSLERMLNDDMAKICEADPNADLFGFFIQSKNGGNEGAFKKFELYGDDMVLVKNLSLMQKTAHFNTVVSNAFSNFERDDSREQKIEIGMLRRFADHVEVLSGRMCGQEVNENGCIEAVVTANGLVKMNLLVGEELEFRYLKDADGNPIRIYITGVIAPTEDPESPFVEDLSVFDDELIIREEAFESFFLGENFNRNNLRCNWFYKFDLQSMEVGDIEGIINSVESIIDEYGDYYKTTEPLFVETLRSFLKTENKIHVTLMILQVPVMALLLAFLFMIAGQMISMENNEISLLKSRGAGKLQVGNLYLIQSVIVDVISLIIGFPFGIFICQMIGASESFLQFDFDRILDIRMNFEVILYSLGAAVLSIIVTIIPALKASGLTIVNLKQKKARNDKKLWQKAYLDIIILAVSLYSYYSFSRQTERIAEDVLSGKGLDPLLYLSSVLFILGGGMLFLRIQPYVVKFFYKVFKNKMKPAGYASSLQIIRTGSKQHFVMLFLVLTVSLGIFDSAVARTIISNAEENLVYMTGDDIVLTESWPSNARVVALDPSTELKYQEPDFGKFTSDPNIASAARVYINENALSTKDKVSIKTTVMAFDTKEFGEALVFDSNILDKHINHYLNDLSKNPDYVLVSRSFENVQKYKLWDSITYSNEKGEKITGTICGFIDYWPTYNPTSVEILNDGSAKEAANYLIISHLSTIQTEWGKTPYYVFMKLVDPSKDDFFYDFVEKNNITLTHYTNLADQKQALRKDTLFQGTSGILTMSFIVVLVLCLAGYLIYWIMSIRSRELLFGVLRAMGMRKSEIIRMLINEQLATGVFSIIIGGVIGVVSSAMYVPMIQLAYSGEDQVTPLSLTIQGNDMIKLFGAIFVMVIVCIIVLTRLISSMKITNALKLGED